LRLHEASIAMTPVFWVRGPAVRAPGDGNTDWFAGAVGAKLTWCPRWGERERLWVWAHRTGSAPSAVPFARRSGWGC